MAGHHHNKDVSCVSGGDRTGVILILAPGSPPHRVLLFSFVWTSRPIRLAGTTFYRRESIMELPTKDQSCIMRVCILRERSLQLSSHVMDSFPLHHLRLKLDQQGASFDFAKGRLQI